MLRVVATLMNWRSRLTGIATGDQALFMRRESFDQVGGFPDQPLMEDIEISRRLRALAAPICLAQRVATSGRRWESRGVWRTIVLMWRLRWRYWRGESAQHLAQAYR
jgi:GT2 family glycosyltransferase